MFFINKSLKNCGSHFLNKTFISSALFFLFVILFNSSIAKETNFDFQVYDNRDGINCPEVMCVFADSKSYIWIGGVDGLTKYDGQKFYNYNKFQGLNDSQINCITQNKKGEIYCGTRKGVSIFDGFRFRNIKMKKNILSSASSHYVNCIFISKKNEIFVGCLDGVFKYDEHLNVFLRILAVNCLTTSIISNNKGELFFSTNKGVYYKGKKSHSIISVQDLDKNTEIKSLRYISDDLFWAATNKGFLKLKLFDNQFVIVQKYGTESVSTILECKNNGTLFTGKSGFLFKLKKNSYQSIDLNKRLSHIQITAAVEDYQGNVWLASTLGLVKMVETDVCRAKFSDMISSPIASLANDKSGTIYLGSIDGLLVINNLNVQKLYVSTDPNDKFISALCYKNNELYVGTFSGKVYRYKNNKFELLLKTKNVNACIYRILPLENEEYWITSGEEVIHYKNKNVETHVLSPGYTQDVLIDKSGCIWFANIVNLTLFRDQKMQRASTVFNKFQSFVTLTEDHNGIMWIGTFGNGLLRFYQGKVSQITMLNGLSNDYISSSFFDKKQKTLWIGTMYGVSKIQLDKNSKVLSINNYLNETNRESYGCVQNAITKLVSGNILISVGSELFEINSESTVNKSKVLRLELNTLKVNNKDIISQSKTFFKNDELTRLPVFPSFKFSENNFEFNFNVIDYHSPHKVKYSWKLNGNDKDWTSFNERNYVSYTNLPFGKYCLKIKAINQYGEKSAIISYPFLISKPYYFEWWFILLAIAIPLILIFWLVKLRIRIILKKESEKNRNYTKFAESELKALRAQMNPHFMFNTLNSIQELVLGNDDKTARIYFSDFTKMMRMILENSTQKLISLENEIEFLRLYLNFEKLRFDNKIEIKLEVDDQLETSFIKIPAMLIQPFVENAINHGLLHKETHGRLVIRFEHIDYQSLPFIKCTIEDNGIGRAASKYFNEWKVDQQSSISTAVAIDRIELLNTIFEDKQFFIFITDLFDDEHVAGTRVEVLISI